jgi:hypothetical protein
VHRTTALPRRSLRRTGVRRREQLVARLDLHDWRCYAFGVHRTLLIGLR